MSDKLPNIKILFRKILQKQNILNKSIRNSKILIMKIIHKICRIR